MSDINDTSVVGNNESAENTVGQQNSSSDSIEQAKEHLRAKSQDPCDESLGTPPEIGAQELPDDDTGTKTIGSMMGEIVWLMSQSPVHKYLSLVDLEWLLMPPIILNQYKLFRDDNKKPIAAVLWGYLSEEAELKLKNAGRLAPQDWGNNAQLDQNQGLVPTAGGTLWLVELITPFHNETNKHREQVLSDLANSAFKGKQFKLIHVNPKTGHREELVLGKNNN